MKIKNKNIAACSERSAMAQNLLKFLGFNSEIIFGKLNAVEHAYILYKPEKTNFRILYDPMNPVEYETKEGKNYCPALSMMSDYDYQRLQEGDTYDFNYTLVKRLFINEEKCTENLRKYSSDEYKFKKNSESRGQQKSICE